MENLFLNHKKPAIITSIIAVILCIITAVCFLTNPKKVSLSEKISTISVDHTQSIAFNNGEALTKSNNSETIHYIYQDSKNEPIFPNLTLYKSSKSFHFFFSAFCSTFCSGNYEITKDNSIVCTTDEGDVYIFKTAENGLIFDAENSTELPMYKYSGDAENAEFPIPDGAFFEFTNE